ncbi:MAG: lipid-A-disaccharide synthase [Sphingomonas sp. SCN 67-18]|nr:lipid-A-disaccharide synthase [Sphingomonas sp. SCN 67-18]ODU20944.1 MAG: lipid-A-disaccharide synthase [Sphingomonas sp. SCN 67-18]
MRIFISTGEPSGDLHAASIIHSFRARRPDVQFVGYGGPKMTAAGATLHFQLVDLAIMWFLQAILNIGTFLKLVYRADQFFRDERPDAVILIDYPGFNWWIARRAKARGIPVFYYVPPQLWAWAGWRVKKVRRFVDLVLCSLPFEPRWYQERGVEGAVYVGHPFFDELAERKIDERFLAEQETRSGKLVAILPGSRTLEVIRNLPVQLRAAAKLLRKQPNTRFVIACLHERHAELVRTTVGNLAFELNGLGMDPSTLEIHHGRTAELIRAADVAWSVSGSVSLELMMESLPTVILYTVRRIDLLIARRFIKAKYITLVNLLADRELMPEYLTWEDASDSLAAWADHWLSHPTARSGAAEELTRLAQHVALPGASDRAAEQIDRWLIAHRAGSNSGYSPAYRGPHDAPAPAESHQA